VRTWLDLSLAQSEQVPSLDLPPEMQALLALLPESERRRFEAQAVYTIHPLVREYLLAGLDEAERRDLHRWAAAYHGRPFVETARQTAAHYGKTWTEEQIEQFARSNQGVVGQMVARTDDMAQARVALAQALAWQRNLFAAGAYEPAGEIVTAVVPVLYRWGQRDRAKALLHGSIATRDGFNQAVDKTNLANLLKDEGKLDEALATYEAVYATFAALNGWQQMAVALGEMANVHQNKGEYEKAIELQSRKLVMAEELGNEEYQAISLHQLSTLYRATGDYATALARSQEAEAIFRKLGIEAYAATLHEQGLIYNRLAGVARSAEDLAQAAAHRAQAIKRFQQSLEIMRRIGNEAVAADSLGELGKLLRDDGQMREAIAATSEAVEIVTRLGNPAKVAIGLDQLGTIHEGQGQYRAALEKYEEALALLRQYGSPQEIAIVERHIARVQGKLGG
jgi:tetratricopeptide (TPR) repeat protein